MRFHDLLDKAVLFHFAKMRLSADEYSLLLYLLHRFYHEEKQALVLNLERLAKALSFHKTKLKNSLLSLQDKKIISPPKTVGEDQFCIYFHPDLFYLEEKDKHKLKHEKSAGVYPLIPTGDPHLALSFNREKESKESKGSKGSKGREATLQRIIKVFCRENPGSTIDQKKERLYATKLIEKFSVDEVLISLHFFSRQLSSLKELLEHWDVLQEQFEKEKQSINLDEARQKHLELDESLRKSAHQWLHKAAQYKLTSEEVRVLKLLTEHKYPRRQLFWAYQARSRYHNLDDFFKTQNHLMLAVSSSGGLFKKKPEKES